MVAALIVINMPWPLPSKTADLRREDYICTKGRSYIIENDIVERKE